MSVFASSYLRVVERGRGTSGNAAGAGHRLFGLVAVLPALQVQAAGGVVTDPEGNPWTAQSRGMVAGTPQVHATIVDILSRHTGTFHR